MNVQKMTKVKEVQRKSSAIVNSLKRLVKLVLKEKIDEENINHEYNKWKNGVIDVSMN